eukprot:5146427-Pleurochrysis_carterae.AAC.1
MRTWRPLPSCYCRDYSNEERFHIIRCGRIFDLMLLPPARIKPPCAGRLKYTIPEQSSDHRNLASYARGFL